MTGWKVMGMCGGKGCLLGGGEGDEGLTPTKDEGTCLRRLNMFRKEVH